MSPVNFWKQFYVVFSKSGLIFWVHNVTEPGTEQLQPPQAGPGGTGHGGSITLDQRKPGPIRPPSMAPESDLHAPQQTEASSPDQPHWLVVFLRLHSSSVSWVGVQTFFLSLLNSPEFCSCLSTIWFHQTFSPPTSPPQRRWFLSNLPVLIMVAQLFTHVFCLIQPMIWLLTPIIFSRMHLWNGHWRHGKQLVASVGVKELVASWKIINLQ